MDSVQWIFKLKRTRSATPSLLFYVNTENLNRGTLPHHFLETYSENANFFSNFSISIKSQVFDTLRHIF